MSTTLLSRLFSGREFSIDEMERRYTEHYLIRSTSNSEDPRTVYFTTGTPRGGDAYGTDRGSVVRSVSIKPFVQHDPYYWIKTCVFSSKPLDPYQAGQKPGSPNSRGGFNDNSPTIERPVYKTSGVHREVPAEYDLNGKPYRSSAGQPFSGVTKELTTFVLEIDRNVRTTNQATQYDYLEGGGAVNSDSVFSVDDVGLWKIAAWDSTRQWRQDQEFFKERIVLHFRSEGWRRYILDRGKVHQKKSSKNAGESNGTWGSHYIAQNPTTARDVYGDQIAGEVLLDGRGNRLIDITTSFTSNYTAVAGTHNINVSDTSDFPDIYSDAQRTADGTNYEHSSETGRRNGLYLRAKNEVMQVKQKVSSTVFTVIRGARGTKPEAHSIGDAIFMADFYREYIERPELSFQAIGINWSVAGGN